MLTHYNKPPLGCLGLSARTPWGTGVKPQIMTAIKSTAQSPKKTGDRYVYSVLFFGAPIPSQPRQKFFLFSSLAAVYDVFSVEQIGCSLGNLYNLKVPDGCAYAGKHCIIKREPVVSKRQKRR